MYLPDALSDSETDAIVKTITEAERKAAEKDTALAKISDYEPAKADFTLTKLNAASDALKEAWRQTNTLLAAEKYAEAVIAGWRVIRVTTGMVEDGRAVSLIERALA